ncbi:MAG: hypothetical protein JO250_15075 [Armatimonadetes bacterium]|nr:hypothetical protein [Armatimonadota bacterium]
MNTQKKIAASLAAVTGLAGLTFGGVAVKPASAQVPTPPVTTPNNPGKHRGERHPELRRALRNLNQAKNNLQNAAHDFQGHREQALDLVNKAIDQVQQALASDTQ